MPPHYPWADVCLPHKGFFMLAYLQPLCNGFPICPPPVRRRPAAASRRLWEHARWVARLWRMLDRVRPASLQPSLDAARCPHVPRSTPPHHLTRMSSPLQRSAPRLWWAFQALSVCHLHGFHTTPATPRSRQRRCASRCPRLLRSDSHGAERQRALGLAWFGETQPRGLGRRAPWFGETRPVVWGDDNNNKPLL